MTHKPTLIEFLRTLGAEVRIYDMGRRVQPMLPQDFLAFEHTEIPYPWPMQRQAWFALCLSGISSNQEPVIWFLNLPLDEQGKLVLAARDYFMHRMLEKPDGEKSGKDRLGHIFADNPYRFTPREERMAIFHAKLNRDLKREKSRFFQHALDYFNGKPGWSQWSFVGYQGIADLAVSVNEGRNSAILADAVAKLPVEPLRALCHCLENEQVPADLSQALLKRLEQKLREKPTPEAEVIDLIRGLSQTTSGRIARNLMESVLFHDLSRSIQVLTAISARGWERLKEPQVAQDFLEALAHNDHGQDAFNLCMADLLSLPELKEPMLEALRNPHNSEKLRHSFSAMTAELGLTQ